MPMGCPPSAVDCTGLDSSESWTKLGFNKKTNWVEAYFLNFDYGIEKTEHKIENVDENDFVTGISETMSGKNKLVIEIRKLFSTYLTIS